MGKKKHIKKFKDHDGSNIKNMKNVIQTIHYIDMSDCDVVDGEGEDIFKPLYDSYNHNNGYAFRYEVWPIDSDEGYPKINEYLLTHGCKVGETVIIHSNW